MLMLPRYLTAVLSPSALLRRGRGQTGQSRQAVLDGDGSGGARGTARLGAHLGFAGVADVRDLRPDWRQQSNGERRQPPAGQG